ncbi:hypothetical protein FNH22_15290 [Fulvivirga sp. M361]|uniref:hypothetical protein n=1 Tax=Fulvivirga sp. M361 TaxID=2594266 RepID=UPI00117ADF7F|nr:hypothetical protein [Fulvivirga sp. M361]TRX57770.1 hypothetical protein FNH22_15290 [Fulvivirga sp. M361]
MEKKAHITKIVDDHILYFRFLKGNALENYQVGLQECKDNMALPNVDVIVVVVEDDNTMFNKEMQDIWIMTGDLADQNGLVKWGVVVPSLAKEITIQYLVQGGQDGDRNYEHFISTDEEEVIAWAKSK